MDPVLQSHLPFAPWMDPRTRRLPGIIPVEPGDWLRVDDAYAGQMALRDALIEAQPGVVHALAPGAQAAAVELLDHVLTVLPGLPGFVVEADTVLRPDGVRVTIDRTAPLLTLGRLVQEDLCLLQTGDTPETASEHVLTGAILCFPASWSLAQKFMRPMTGIHVPVDSYDADVARRVQRLFDAIRPEQPLWRANALIYDDATLHQPRREGERRPRPVHGTYLRSERQCLLRLPISRAVVFSIHTYIVRRADLTPEQEDGLFEHMPEAVAQVTR